MEKYEEIINCEHHVSSRHPQMSREKRAAQFAPFAALTGYEAAVGEKARLTEHRMELDENERAILDGKLQCILESMDAPPEVNITYFCPDAKKEGGSYETVAGCVKKIDEYANVFVMMDGKRIEIDEIVEIEII